MTSVEEAITLLIYLILIKLIFEYFVATLTDVEHQDYGVGIFSVFLNIVAPTCCTDVGHQDYEGRV